jgi:hypothetical protein
MTDQVSDNCLSHREGQEQDLCDPSNAACIRQRAESLEPPASQISMNCIVGRSIHKPQDRIHL